MEQEFDHLKAEPRFRCEYLSDGRVGYCAADNESSVFGRVFTKSCSGKCIISILVMAAGTNDAPVEGKALLQKYAKVLALGDFGGE